MIKFKTSFWWEYINVKTLKFQKCKLGNVFNRTKRALYFLYKYIQSHFKKLSN